MNGKGKEPKASEITKLLNRWKAGDQRAGDALFELIYPDLRKIVGRILNQQAGNFSLQTTDVLHEAYLRLLGQKSSWENRHHFFAVSARVVRRVVMDHVRGRARDKRGGEEQPVPLDQARETPSTSRDWLALDEALSNLAAADATAARICELRYFGGLTLDEIASVLRIGRATAVRHWQFARAWLKHVLNG